MKLSEAVVSTIGVPFRLKFGVAPERRWQRNNTCLTYGKQHTYSL